MVSSLLVHLAGGGRVDPVLTALHPAPALRQVVAALETPQSVLRIALDLGTLPFSPTLWLLESAGSIEALVRRWCALERAWEIRDRTDLRPDGPTGLVLAFGSRAPPSQDLVVAGAVAGLLRAQGFGGLGFAARSGPRWSDLDWVDGGSTRFEPAPGTTYRLSWGSAPSRWSPRLEVARDRHPVRLVDPDRTRAEVARAARVSLRTLDRRFRALDLTVEQVRRRLRIRAATLAIAESDRTLTDVAYEVGFADGAHLSRAFRAASGMTPTAYRAAR